LLEGQAQNSENSQRLLGGTPRVTFSKKGGKRFEAVVDLSKKKRHQGNVPSCIKNEDLTFPR
jgi:hypothetical protein